jgi:hypothetical protein
MKPLDEAKRLGGKCGRKFVELKEAVPTKYG